MPRIAKQPFKSSPYTIFNSITTSDSVNLSPRPRAVYVRFGGDVTIEDDDGNTILIGDVQGGTFLPISPVKIHATGTDATGLLGCN